VDSSIAKVLQDYRPASGGDAGTGRCFGQLEALPRSQLPPDFADVFRGYQRLSLLSLHLAFGRQHKIFFVHKGNWNTLLPRQSLAACTPNGHLFADTLSDGLRLDWVKSHILATYGGYWFPPDALVVRDDLHTWMHEDILPTARANPNVPLDTPLLVLAGIREVAHSQATEWFKDSNVLFAEPRNPVLLRMAAQLDKVVRTAPAHSSYDNQNWFTKALHVYSSPQRHGVLARSVVVLPPSVNGAVDNTGQVVTAEQYFRQRPLDHLPHPDAYWFVVDTPDRRITSYPRYEWFAYLTEEAIVQSTLWISLLYRRALGMDTESNTQQGTFRRSVALHDERHPLRLAWVRSWTTN